MATSHLQPVASRSATNRANALLSTGPRTDSGKQRSSLNALRHGLTAASAVLPSEDQAAFDAHRRGFFDEYQPATPTETQLTQELADTAWRLNRIPLLEASLLDRAANPPLDALREIQDERRREQERQLKSAAALLELHKHKGIPWQPADNGFVFSKDQVERFSQRLILLNQSRHIEHVRFHMR